MLLWFLQLCWRPMNPSMAFTAVRFFSRQCDIVIVYDAEILEISVNFWVMRPGRMIKIACANCPCVHLLLISGRTWHTPAELCSSPFEYLSFLAPSWVLQNPPKPNSAEYLHLSKGHQPGKIWPCPIRLFGRERVVFAKSFILGPWEWLHKYGFVWSCGTISWRLKAQ